MRLNTLVTLTALAIISALLSSPQRRAENNKAGEAMRKDIYEMKREFRLEEYRILRAEIPDQI